MENKVFKKIAKNCFERYGFQYFEKRFYLDLPNIVIEVRYFPYRFGKGVSLNYGIRIKALSHLTGEIGPETVAAFDDASVIPVQTPLLLSVIIKKLNGTRMGIFDCEEWDESEWEKGLTEALHFYFDPFKENDLERMKYQALSVDPDIGLVVNNDVKKFLGIKE